MMYIRYAHMKNPKVELRRVPGYFKGFLKDKCGVRKGPMSYSSNFKLAVIKI